MPVSMLIAVKTLIVFALQWLIGYGMIRLIGYRQRSSQMMGLSILAGLGCSSVVVFILEMIRVPLNFTSISISLFLVAAGFWKSFLQVLRNLGRPSLPRFYEFLFLGVILYLVFISVWKCFYSPVTPFDAKVGIDLVAKYAILEGTIASSVFTQHIPSTWYWSNQPFYAPFTMLMQVIFRSTGLPFGKLWLSFLLIGFLIFFYSKLKSNVHPVIAGILVLAFLAVPEFYAYTFLIQTDLNNALFFAVAVILFADYFTSDTSDWSSVRLSILFMSLAVWSRSETIVIAPLGSLLILWKEYRSGSGIEWKYSSAYILLPLLLFVVWNFIYVKTYLPVSPNTLSELDLNLESYFGRLRENMSAMIIVMIRPEYWNYLTWTFIGAFLLNLVLFRRFEGSHAVLWMLVLFVLYVLMVQHIPAVGIGTTFRRGVFKFLPLMIMVLSQIPLTQWLSQRMIRWEAR